MQISEITKSVINVATLVVSVGTLILHETSGFLPGNLATIVAVVVGLAGAIVHFLAPNTTTDPTVAATQSVRLRDGVQPRSGVKHHTPPSV